MVNGIHTQLWVIGSAALVQVAQVSLPHGLARKQRRKNIVSFSLSTTDSTHTYYLCWLSAVPRQGTHPHCQEFGSHIENQYC